MDIFELINSGKKEKVKELVDRDIQEHGRSTILNFYESKFESTPLIWAACLGRTSLVEFFLSRGADINARDIHNRTALIWAADRGDVETALCLINHGADLEVKENEYESTALNWAAWRKRLGVVKALVDAGAVIDTPNFNGQTALQLGLGVDDDGLEITEVLLEAGARLTQDCKTIAKYADFVGREFPLLSQLVQHGAEIDEKTFEQVRINICKEKENQLLITSNQKVPYTSELIVNIYFKQKQPPNKN